MLLNGITYFHLLIEYHLTHLLIFFIIFIKMSCKINKIEFLSFFNQTFHHISVFQTFQTIAYYQASNCLKFICLIKWCPLRIGWPKKKNNDHTHINNVYIKYVKKEICDKQIKFSNFYDNRPKNRYFQPQGRTCKTTLSIQINNWNNDFLLE